MTNFDSIKAMTLEELAFVLYATAENPNNILAAKLEDLDYYIKYLSKDDALLVKVRQHIAAMHEREGI